MALVLLYDPNDNHYVVCVHIHFHNANTSLNNVSGVNLIHHKLPPRNVGSFILEDPHDEKHKFKSWETHELVRQCKAYVDENDPGRWADHTRWNMRRSFNNSFRLEERSAWMDDYVKEMIKNDSQTS
jgi:hypothetical protein